MKRIVLIIFLLIVTIFSNGCSIEVNQNTGENDNSVNGSDELQVYYLDVGQGDSIYIKTPAGDDILIDAGENSYGDTVVNYLHELHVDDIEVMIATHPHSDHIGGLDTVLKNFKVKSVYAPKISHTSKSFEDFLNAVIAEGLKIKTAKEGVIIPLTGVKAEFVGPVKDDYEDMNNWSAVLYLSYKENRFIFTGDAEEEAEKDMISTGFDLKADVLKVGHHGSHTSSSEEFLNAVDPQYAVISLGKDNRYGHPHEETLTKLNQRGITIYRTDKQGTILAKSDGHRIIFTEKALQH